MQSIVVKYSGANGKRGARYIARAYAGSVSIPIDHALDHLGNCTQAAIALCAKYGWAGAYAAGTLPPGFKCEYVFVPMVKAFNARGAK